MSREVTFGSWLKQRRTELGITRDEFSEQLGFSLDLLRKLESGERRPSGQIAHLVADYFRIPEDEREAFVTFARTGGTATQSPPADDAERGASTASPATPWRRAYVQHTNLPTMLTPLIGRERELATARDLILRSKMRLLTLTGPPGIGKTRLGLQVAAELVDHFEDGVYFVDLAPILDPEQVLPAAARSLGLKESGSRTLADVLTEHVREKRLLLLLDNFEQVLDAAPDVVRLLQASPWLRVLATSREALHVRGEQRLPVPPLALPDMNKLPLLGTLADYPSVGLFIERAQASVPEFGLAKEDAEDVAAVCVGLEGLPLAIELAAARADLLSPREMRTALDSRLKLLDQGARDLPLRQRTLRNAIEWSYGLLDGDEQRLFRHLSVFVGGFTLEAAEATCKMRGDISFASLAASLADKNLLTVERGDGALRFRMLETIREYALERLQESGERETLSKAHALYFTRMAEKAKSSLVRANDLEPMNRLGADYNNVRTALLWAREEMHNQNKRGPEERARAVEAGEIGLRLVGAVWPYWYTQGYISEGREEMAATLAGATSPALRPYMADALNGAGALAYEQGDTTSARSLYEQSLPLRREIGDLAGVANTLNNLGMLAHEEGDHASARSFYEESLAVSREMGDKVSLSKALNNLGELVYDEGDYEYARTLNEESLAIKRELGDKMGIASSLNNLGVMSHLLGDHVAARQFHAESLAIRREVGDKRGIGSSLNNLGLVAYDQGDFAGALSLHRETLAIRWEMGGKLLVLESLVGLSRLAAQVGDARRGARLLGALDALWKAMGLTATLDMRRVYEQGMASAQARLEEEPLEQALAEGRAMNMDEAVQYALDGGNEG